MGRTLRRIIFMLEALDRPRWPGAFCSEWLSVVAQFDVFGLEDLSHATLAEETNQVEPSREKIVGGNGCGNRLAVYSR